ncbi:DUF2520 domain-containing protein [bacterium]|nr:DUF2520 domain-containing protein [bacterium]
MRQVPGENVITPYLIIGNGRLASHISYYFQLLEIPFLRWWRDSGFDLGQLISKSSKALVLISDDAIEPFIRQNQQTNNTLLWIHCSGLLDTPLAHSAHPLMTFSDSLYGLETYKKTPFVTVAGATSFPGLFPELSNPFTEIPAGQKAFYHAWCSLAGNSTSMLWQELFSRMEQELGISREMLYPFLNQTVKNLQQSKAALTGPLTRGDEKSIQAHQSSLKNDPFLNVYRAFISVYQSSQKTGVKP